MSDENKHKQEFSLEEQKSILKKQLENIEAEVRLRNIEIKRLKALLKAYDKVVAEK